MKTWTEKSKWLKQHGYIILAAPDGSGWTATNNNGLQVDFNETAMSVHNEAGNTVTGWLEMDLLSFELQTIALGIVHLTAQERDEMQAILNENYALQFTNHLS